jgi:hypothetical protein
MSDLPPLDQSQAYVVVGPNDQRGPYTMELLISEVLAGRLSEATPVWWPGLADWTTMGGHPGVMAELARRRSPAAPAAPAPAWAEPVPAADPYAQPTPAADPYAQPTPAADPYAQPAADPYAQPAADPFAAPVADDDVVEAEVVEAELVVEGPDGEPEVLDVEEVVVVDPAHDEAFAALVVRSSARAQVQSRIDAVNDELVDAVVAGVSAQGFALGERVDVDRGAELRFDGADGDLVMVSLGRAGAVRPEDLRDDHVPVTVSYRSAAQDVRASDTTGAHGEVVIAADEWTGQSTSSVSLFLGLGDYLDETLAVDRGAVERDLAATVAVLRSKLG